MITTDFSLALDQLRMERHHALTEAILGELEGWPQAVVFDARERVAAANDKLAALAAQGAATTLDRRAIEEAVYQLASEDLDSKFGGPEYVVGQIAQLSSWLAPDYIASEDGAIEEVEMSTVPCDELYGDAAECLQEASVGACDAEDCASLVDRFNATCTQEAGAIEEVEMTELTPADEICSDLFEAAAECLQGARVFDQDASVCDAAHQAYVARCVVDTADVVIREEDGFPVKW